MSTTSAPSIPKTMRAVAQHPQASAPNSVPFAPSEPLEHMHALVQDVPVPQLEANDVLIKVAYAAQNPTDYKHSYYMSPPGSIIGCDFSGTVIRTGSGTDLATPLKPGDRVAGCVHGGLFTDKGSYAEYLRAQSDLVFKVPEGMGMREAATFGVPWVTAAQTLVHEQKRKLPPAQVSDGEWILIYGGSTSVGLFALQLAAAMGYRIITTASPRNFDLVKSYGAHEVVDYHDGPAASARIREVTGGGVVLGLDCVSAGDSFGICLDAYKEGEEQAGRKRQLNCVLPPGEEAQKMREDVAKPFTLMYSLLGKDWNLTPMGKPNNVPAPKEDHEFGKEIFARTSDLITRYKIRPPPIRLRGGLDDVTNGWKEQDAGKVSGVKLVYRIDPQAA